MQLGPRHVGHPPAVVVQELPGVLKTRPPPAVVLDLDSARRVEAALLDQSDDRYGGHADGLSSRTWVRSSVTRWCDMSLQDRCRAGAAGDPVPVTYTATASYPYDDRERATRALRGHLRMTMPGEQMPDWSTLDVSGPKVEIDGMGRGSPTRASSRAADPCPTQHGRSCDRLRTSPAPTGHGSSRACSVASRPSS